MKTVFTLRLSFRAPRPEYPIHESKQDNRLAACVNQTALPQLPRHPIRDTLEEQAGLGDLVESAFPLDSLVLFFQSQVLLLCNWRFYQLLILNSLSLFVEVGGSVKEGEAQAARPPVSQAPPAGCATPPVHPRPTRPGR